MRHSEARLAHACPPGTRRLIRGARCCVMTGKRSGGHEPPWEGRHRLARAPRGHPPAISRAPTLHLVPKTEAVPKNGTKLSRSLYFFVGCGLAATLPNLSGKRTLPGRPSGAAKPRGRARARASAPSKSPYRCCRALPSVRPLFTIEGYKDFALAAHEDLVRQLVAEQPDITLAELEGRLAKKKIRVGKSSISRFLHHLKLPFKKKSAGSRARSPRRGRRP